MNFKGKVATYTAAGPSFVVSFTCSNGAPSGNWTYDVGSASYSETLAGSSTGPTSCGLSSSGNGGTTWSTIPATMEEVPLTFQGQPVATLTLVLAQVGATKTSCPDTTPPCHALPPTAYACMQITTSRLVGSTFSFRSPGPGYGTLNLTLPKA
jgi:hypothetical protein